MGKELKSKENKIAYLIHTFPLFSLTFIVDEIDELRRQGCVIDIFSIRKPDTKEYPIAYHRFFEETKYLFPLKLFNFLWRHFQVFFSNPVGYLSTLYYGLSVKDQGIKGRFKFLLYFTEAIYFLPLLQRSGCKHLHVHFLFGGAVIAMVLNKLANITYSLTAHGTDFLVEKHLLKEKMLNATFIRVGTEYNADILRTILGPANVPDKLFVLPFGIDVGYRPVSVSKINQLSPVKIINIGRLVWQKGQLLLIDAIFNLRKSGYDFTLDIIGEGELRPAIEERITACNLGGVVTLLGALPREQTLQHLAQADIFVFSSVSEGFGIVLLEAMLCQVAIVAPRLNGIPEIIQNDETGLLFEVGSVSDLSDKIEALITDAPKRHLLVETAYKVVRETYDQKHLMTKLLEKHQSCN